MSAYPCSKTDKYRQNINRPKDRQERQYRTGESPKEFLRAEDGTKLYYLNSSENYKLKETPYRHHILMF